MHTKFWLPQATAEGKTVVGGGITNRLLLFGLDGLIWVRVMMRWHVCVNMLMNVRVS
jgi:hypothetical protein